MSPKKTSNWREVVAITLVLLASGQAFGHDGDHHNEEQASEGESVRRRSPSPPVSASYSGDETCGIACLHAGLRMLGSDVKFADLVSKETLTPILGSSYGQLIRAAEAQGYHAVAEGGLTTYTLRSSDNPMILHVKRDLLTSQHHDHYVLFAGIRGDEALVVDPPLKPDWVPLGVLLARWDGKAGNKEGQSPI